MSGVGSWDPEEATIDDELIDHLLGVHDNIEQDELGLEQSDIDRLAQCMRAGAEAWTEAAAGRADEDLVTLIQVLTVAEAKLSACEAGARSPVVPLAAELKRRHAYPEDLTAWIKAHSDNRFLPHGNLMDRL